MPETEIRQLTIGEAAAAAGVATSTIRYYEGIGVLPEPERLSGQRRYTSDVLARLRFIDLAQRAGFSLEEIRELLHSSDSDQGVERLRVLAEEKLPDVERLILRAQIMRGWLEAATQCRCSALDVCDLFGEEADSALPESSTRT